MSSYILYSDKIFYIEMSVELEIRHIESLCHSKETCGRHSTKHMKKALIAVKLAVKNQATASEYLGGEC